MKTLILLAMMALTLTGKAENVKIDGQEYAYQVTFADLVGEEFHVVKSFHDDDGKQRYFKQIYKADGSRVIHGKSFVKKLGNNEKWVEVPVITKSIWFKVEQPKPVILPKTIPYRHPPHRFNSVTMLIIPSPKESPSFEYYSIYQETDGQFYWFKNGGTK